MATTPFGIEIGSPLSSVEKIQDLGQSIYEVSAPKPHPDFTTYIAQGSEKYCIVWVKAIGPDIANDTFGHAVQAKIDKLRRQLEGKYGPSRVQDFLMDGSIWEDDRDWTMAVHQNERFYSATWRRSEAANLPNDLDTVYLGVTASDGSTTNIVLEYASPALQAVEAEADEANADLL